jgi:hypothetical protein
MRRFGDDATTFPVYDIDSNDAGEEPRSANVECFRTPSCSLNSGIEAVMNSEWACNYCNRVHSVDSSKSALEPFRKRCGWTVNTVAKDGDCFYTAVCKAISMNSSMGRSLPEAGVDDNKNSLTVHDLRSAVAAQATSEQLRFYQIFADAKY